MALETFTTVELTRIEGGWQNNALITDAILQPNVDSANAEIESCVGVRYVVPLSSNTNYSGSYAENLLKELATQLAASETQLQEYEGQGGSLMRMHQNRVDHIRGKLQDLKSGKIPLYDTAGVELALKEAALSAVTGFPKNSDMTDPDEPTTVEPIAIMNEKF
jgi:hypothetical protein